MASGWINVETAMDSVKALAVNMDRIHCLVISLSHMVGVFVLTQVLRKISKTVLPKTIYPYVAEVICLFQLTVCSFENGLIIYPEYGIVMYAFIMYLLTVGYCITFDGHGNPCGIFHELLQKRITLASVSSAAFKMACSVIGGLVALQHVKAFWSFGALNSHLHHVDVMKQPCHSAMKTYVIYGVTAELIATFIVRFVDGLSVGGKRWHKFVFAFVVVTVTLTGADYTGMMFNPALATTITSNCVGHPIQEHVLVYWIGPFLATIMAMYLLSIINQTKQQVKKKSNTENTVNGNVKLKTDNTVKSRTRKRKKYY
ncbi:aquaporin-11-like [Glandiceps talaboti]